MDDFGFRIGVFFYLVGVAFDEVKNQEGVKASPRIKNDLSV